jgi:hypothetical protein
VTGAGSTTRVESPTLVLRASEIVIDGVFDTAAAGAIVFNAASGIDANAIVWVQAQVRRRPLRVFVRRDLLPGDDARATGQWERGRKFSAGRLGARRGR